MLNMMKLEKFLFSCALLALSGCMTNVVDPNLPSNVRTSNPDSYGNLYIDRIDFSYQGRAESGARAARCTAMNVSNNSVVLSDSSNSFVGRYTGNFYNVDRSVTVSGSNILQYTDEASGVAVASGRVEAAYTFGGLPIEKIIDFKVLVDASSGRNIRVTFSDIRAAQKKTGYASNTGFIRSGAWPGAKPVVVHNALKNIADRIANCM